MTRISDQTYATLELRLDWNSPEARHVERFLARKVNLWRDIFPPGMDEALAGLEPGRAVSLDYAPGQAIPERDPGLIRTLPTGAFETPTVEGRRIVPRVGRYYPRGLFGGLPGIYPQDARPARLLEADGHTLTVDLNHPLAGRPLRFGATVLDVAPKRSDTGGRLSHWLEEVVDFGPGMQARRPGGQPTDFTGPGGPARLDEGDDAFFYAAPRLVGHVDAQASAILQDICMARLHPGDSVLDLMSSLHSHLDPGADLCVTGLGLNAQELAANPVLKERLVQNLNADPRLPFAEAAFDAALVSLSVEYLTDPRAVVRELARTIRPGGTLMIGFSNRWFPTKASRLWLDLHEFERMGLVLDYLLEDGGFADLWTESARNWWRPADDPHVRLTWTSDPVYVVGGTRR